MFPSQRKTLSITLFLYVTLALVLVQGVSANNAVAHRMLRKRADLPLGPLAGAQPAPSISSTPPTESSAAPSVSAAVASVSSVPPVVSTSASASATSTERASVTATSASASASVTETSASSTASASSISSAAAAPSSESVAAAPTKVQESLNLTSAPKPSSGDSDATVFSTSIKSVVAAQQTGDSTPAPAATGATSAAKKVSVVFIVIAACIGGAAIIWTIIRKWKFKPSAEFEDRMAPIDWQPTNDEPSAHGVHRANSTASFVSSGSHGQGMAGRGAGAGGYGATSETGHGTRSDALDHDFTAGAPSMAPVGGYADLARGPSPPQMHQVGGPVAYDQYAPQQQYDQYPAQQQYDTYQTGPKY